jgi:hypothetical protein
LLFVRYWFVGSTLPETYLWLTEFFKSGWAS